MPRRPVHYSRGQVVRRDAPGAPAWLRPVDPTVYPLEVWEDTRWVVVARLRKALRRGEVAQVSPMREGALPGWVCVTVHRLRPAPSRWRLPLLVALAVAAGVAALGALVWWALAGLATVSVGGWLLLAAVVLLALGGTGAGSVVVKVVVKR